MLVTVNSNVQPGRRICNTSFVAVSRRILAAASALPRGLRVDSGGNGRLGRCLRCRYSLDRAGDSVSHTAHGLNQPPAGIAHPSRVHLAAQVIDVDVHDVGARLRAHLPDFLEQLAARHAFAAVQQQTLEQGKLLRGQADGQARARYLVLDAVQLKIVATEHRVGKLLASAQQGPATRSQLNETKWLKQAIVRPHIQALQTVRATSELEVEDTRVLVAL